MISTFIPIKDKNNGGVIGAFEIYSDVTGLVRISNLIQLKIGIAVVAGMFLIYTILFKMAHRADKIIN